MKDQKNVIEVRGIKKRYRLGEKVSGNDTLFGFLSNAIKSPVRNFKRIRKLSNFKDESSIHWALRQIDFSVEEGEVLGIIGHNGAGKSTLLKVLSRVTEPTEGEIEVKGRLSALLEVGTGFHPELSGRDNVYMNGTILGMSKKEIDAKFDDIIQFSGVAKHIDTPVKFYSSGMKVRLGFAVAAHLEPEILVVDEVLAVGDADFQRKCIGKMKDVSSSGRTVLFVSHDMTSIENLCQRVLVMDKGQVVFEGDAHSAVKFYIGGLGDQKSLEFPMTKDPLRINNISINDSASTIIQPGESIKIDLDYEVTGGEAATGQFKLWIYNDAMKPIASLSNHFVKGQEENKLPAKGRTRIAIPETPLNVGRYHISLKFRRQKAEKFVEFARILSFDVVQGAYGNYRRMPDHEFNMLLDSEWNFD